MRFGAEVAQLALGASLLAIGWWGRRRAPALVPGPADDPATERRVGAVRRGALACGVLGAVFVVITFTAAL